jgi:hypothetical protein
MAPTIGIKIANGEFYPILEENSTVKKRLVLTTVHNKQASVHIDLYRSDTPGDDIYIGSLVIEHIKAKPRGEPSIELTISSNDLGEILAEAADLDSPTKGAHDSLQVSLKPLDLQDDPDFTADFDPPPAGLYEPEADNAKKKRLWPAVVLALLFLGLLCFGAWLVFFNGFTVLTGMPLFFFRDRELSRSSSNVLMPPLTLPAASTVLPEEYPPPEPPAPPAQISPLAELSALPAVIESPAEPPPQEIVSPARDRSKPPAASYKVPTAIPRGGVMYKIRWGDTLWDISEAFYRNPWLYPNIVRFNNIRNPDLIVSGKTIRIPPRR